MRYILEMAFYLWGLSVFEKHKFSLIAAVKTLRLKEFALVSAF